MLIFVIPPLDLLRPVLLEDMYRPDRKRYDRTPVRAVRVIPPKADSIVKR